MTVTMLKKQTVDGVELVDGDSVHLVELEGLAETINVKEGYGKITTEKKKGGTGTEKVIKIKEGEGYAGPTCNVGYKMGYTKNLGNFESLRIDVSVNMPCYTTEIGTVFTFCKEWVDDRMNETVEEIEKESS